MRQGGLVVFDFAEYPAGIMSVTGGPEYFGSLMRATQARVKLINAFSLCLHSSRSMNENLGTDTFQIRHRDLVHPGAESSEGMGGLGLQGFPPMVNGGYLRERHRHGVVPEISLSRAFETLDFVVQHESDKALDLVTLLNDAATLYGNHQFHSSLITAWTLCETILQHKWSSYIEAQAHSEVKSVRRQKLTGRDFTASVVSEVLELAGAINKDTLTALDKARKARNAWMHSIKSPVYGDASDCLVLAAAMLSENIGREVRVNVGLSATGF
ncbi:hypothetical protein [Streptomyces ficellus]|uniref:Apea-like HEPN domain-containing protein n=1 Tax=Streptomyces ficellus TaxID=1977088 RepID=A0A6I6F6Y6_9ACTN|nr:hypothetical protein [Streptomyces ficellus]QGV79773.1 hypothetical protein EIZ62_17165 [Streptomyces ficellus]